MKRVIDLATVAEIEKEGARLLDQLGVPDISFGFVEVTDASWRWLFDRALDEIHYAGACQRVGRCMRLAIIEDGKWVGGIVLGSTFPNIRVRDEAFGLRKYIEGWRERGLKSPWARENTAYWSALQKIVNHARTFIFPRFQGAGRGIRAHRLLLTEGVALWKAKYQDEVIGLDTLCTHPDSRLFKDNGWILVGRTEGYTSDPSRVFSKRAFKEDWKTIKNNIALRRIEGSTRWFVWVKPLVAIDLD
jgi:hypothetical protein